MNAVRALRLLLGAGGLVVIAAGASVLVGKPLPALVSIAIFLAGGVITHDALIAPATAAGGAAASRLLPRAYLAPLVAAVVLVGTLTLASIPVLVGVNESPTNQTLRDRPYLVSWLVILAVTALAVLVAGRLRSRRTARTPNG